MVGLIVWAIARRHDLPPRKCFWTGFGAALLTEAAVVAAIVGGGSAQPPQFGTAATQGDALAVSVDTAAQTITVTVKDESHDCRDLPAAQIMNDGDEIKVAALLLTPQVHTPPCPAVNPTVLHTNTALGKRNIVIDSSSGSIVLKPKPDGTYDPYVR
jgi:hypothetical protein